MSHKTTFSCSNTYLNTELGLTRKCNRKNCPGILTQVWVRYKDKGPLQKEEECTCCGKVVKPYRKRPEGKPYHQRGGRRDAKDFRQERKDKVHNQGRRD